MRKKAAVVNRGWMGDAIACSAAAASLAEAGYETTLFIRWPQLKPILDNDKRFVTKLYGRFLSYKIRRPLFPAFYDVIAVEPPGWAYEEPHSAEMRRIAGCEPLPQYRLLLTEAQIGMTREALPKDRPVIAVARDSYKRAYGRDVDRLVAALSAFAEVRWVGLSPDKDSKQGKHASLIRDASIISNSDLFLGPEGGLLWVAAGVGTRCVYFTEHIMEIDRNIKRGHPSRVIGSKHHFPGGSHIDLPPYCSNDQVVKTIAEILEQR
ncbi:MAG: hypothetical protein HGB04_07930 [Chlorobiaceae bacterium]|nr:hypothetical protein [Chlorobiaceae bacterium]